MIDGNRGFERWGAAVALVCAIGGFAACAKPTAEECHAAIKHVMELQIDEMPKAMAQAGVPANDMPTGPNGQSAQDMLKADVDRVIQPAAVARCVDQLKKADIDCTMAATTTDALVQHCHWKDLPGGRVGF